MSGAARQASRRNWLYQLFLDDRSALHIVKQHHTVKLQGTHVASSIARCRRAHCSADTQVQLTMREPSARRSCREVLGWLSSTPSQLVDTAVLGPAGAGAAAGSELLLGASAWHSLSVMQAAVSELLMLVSEKHMQVAGSTECKVFATSRYFMHAGMRVACRKRG